MNENPLQSIVIAGGGADGWVAAAAIANELRNQAVTIRLVEDPTAEATGRATPTLPLTHAFHSFLGIDETPLVKATGASFRLGTRFLDWGEAGADVMQPVGPHGAGIEHVAFHHFANRARMDGDTTPYEDYSLPAAAARAGRFARPVADPASILYTMAYALHLDMDRYAAFMRRYATELGVEAIPGTVESVALRPEDGFIAALTLTDGRSVDGDLFLDCTGPQSLLLGTALGVPYEDWSALLPGDREAGVLLQPEDPLPTCSTIRALDSGWLHSVPLQHGSHERIVYAGGAENDDRATVGWPAELRDQVRFRSLRPGRREAFWHRNCVALGEAAGAFQPMDGAGLSCLQNGIMRLLGLLPLRDSSPLLAEEYNRLTGLEYQNIRDFQALQYLLNHRAGGGFWPPREQAELPPSLDRRERLFRCNGHVALYEEETFTPANWSAAWIGHGVWPAGYEPMLDSYDLDRLQERFSRMRTLITEGVRKMPLQRDFLAAAGLAGPA